MRHSRTRAAALTRVRRGWIEPPVAASLGTLLGEREGGPDAETRAALTPQQVQQLSTRLQHLSELLAESEDAVLRLTAQERVLKDEIRRLDSVHSVRDLNAEYAKNVLFKFFSAPDREVRTGLDRPQAATPIGGPERTFRIPLR